MIGENGIRLCPSCGRTNPAEAVLCEACGTGLGGVPVLSGPPAPAPSAPPAVEENRPEAAVPEEPLVPYAIRGGRDGVALGGGPLRVTVKRRHPLPLVLGLVVVVAGVVLIAAIYEYNARPEAVYIPPRQYWTLSTGTLTGLTATVHWTGGGSGARLYVTVLHPDCVQPGGVVKTGSGGTGDLSVEIDPGTTYYLFGCAGGADLNQGLNLTLHAYGGLTLPELGACFGIGIGVGLVAMGLRATKYLRHPRRPAEE